MNTKQKKEQIDILIQKINENIVTYKNYTHLTGIILRLDILPSMIGENECCTLIKMIIDSCRRVVVETMVCLEELESVWDKNAMDEETQITIYDIRNEIESLKNKNKNFNIWVKYLE